MGLFSRSKDEKSKQASPTTKVGKAAVKAVKEEVKEEKKVEVEMSDRPIAVAKDIKFPAYRILSKPVVTEKSTYLMSGNNTYCFYVDPKTTKNDVKKAVSAVYGVKVLGVRMLKKAGKIVRFGKISGKRKNIKKAYVTLAKGQNIEIHKNV